MLVYYKYYIISMLYPTPAVMFYNVYYVIIIMTRTHGLCI